MSKYENPRESATESKGPHPQFDKNLSYYNRMLGKVEFSSKVKIEIQRNQFDFTCALFVHGPVEARKGAYLMSFHLDHSSFRKELCDILNSMGYTGLLKRKEVDEDDKWGNYKELSNGNTKF